MILFRKEDKKWGCFSNFYQSPVVIDGFQLLCAEAT